MSIAEIIMAGTGQQARQTNVLADNLSTLGQQIGQQMALREYQKQAQAALPALQQSYTSAMDKIEAGNLSEGYRDILNAQLQFGTTQNPFIARMNEMAGGIAEQAASNYMKEKLYGMQYGPKGTSQQGIPAVDASRYGFEGAQVAPAMGGEMEAQFIEGDMTQGTPAQREMQAQADAQYGTYEQADMEAADQLPTRGGMPEPTPAQAAAAQNFQDLTAQPLDQQAEAARQYTVSEDAINTDQYELVKISGVEKYLPDFVGFAVPKEKWKESGATLTGTGMLSRQSKLTAPEARENFFKTGAEKESRGTEQNIKEAVETMKDRQMTSLFNEFGKDIYALRQAAGAAPTPQGGITYSVTKKDGKDQRITEGQFMAIQELAAIVPATAENAGGTPAVFKARKKTPKDLVATAKQELGPQATKDQILARARELANQ